MTWKELQLDAVDKALYHSARAITFSKILNSVYSEDAAYSAAKQAFHYARLAQALQDAYITGVEEGFRPILRVTGRPQNDPFWWVEIHRRLGFK